MATIANLTHIEFDFGGLSTPNVGGFSGYPAPYVGDRRGARLGRHLHCGHGGT